MFPTYGSPNYAAIERQAHELRRQALAEIGRDLRISLLDKLSALQALVASVRHGMQRSRSQAFFEAQ
jgi:hypothetical protein